MKKIKISIFRLDHVTVEYKIDFTDINDMCIKLAPVLKQWEDRIVSIDIRPIPFI